MTDASRGAQKGISWTMLVVGGLLLVVGAFLAISGVGIAFGLPIIIVGAAFVWLARRTQPRG